MVPRLAARRWPVVGRRLAAALAVAVAAAGCTSAADRGGRRPAGPFRIAGNLYSVGVSGVAALLITGPNGHVLIDGGRPGTAPAIVAAIARLGFDVRDVRVVLTAGPHVDRAGRLAALRRAAGAELWASGAAPPYQVLVWGGPPGYPTRCVDRRPSRGRTIRLGPVELTARVAGGRAGRGPRAPRGPACPPTPS